METLKKRFRTAMTILKKEGIIKLIKKVILFVIFKIRTRNRIKYSYIYTDVLFVNGCTLQHPKRYRVDHQMEQLKSYNVSVNLVEQNELNNEMIKYCHAIIIYRCPYTIELEDFINLAKQNNKVIFFDIDDLVIDTKYTDNIKYIKEMSLEERNLYNDGVKRFGKTLSLCDYAITTTEGMAKELKKYCKEVYINKNVISEKMSELSDIASQNVLKDDKKVILGYFSGSITHNPDFELVSDAIIKIMNEYDNVYLKVVGILEIPEKFKPYSQRIIIEKFVDWQKLPELIASVDINLAPIEESIFNNAKSENKWTEAAYCKTLTIASNRGAFKTAIDDNETGILSNDDEWYEKIKYVIENRNKVKEICEKAYKKVEYDYVTTYSGKGLADYVNSKIKKSFLFVLPSTNISGGVLVTLKHCQVLKKNGYDVTILNLDKKDENVYNNGEEIFVIRKDKTKIDSYFDTGVATLWSTLKYIKKMKNIKNIIYLVQSFETNFFPKGREEKFEVNSTYSDRTNVKYLTVSNWCKEWLNERYGKKVYYIPNGIDSNLFNNSMRKESNSSDKIKILIEGNCIDHYKNVDYSFKITNCLDRNKYEINYLSYTGKVKDWYVYDNLYSNIKHEEVSQIYSANDILIKTSILESFSYPPLEMMATGGVCLVLPNEGNIEFLKDKYNCIFLEKDNIEDALKKIEELATNEELRKKLIINGYKTVKEREWSHIEKTILEMYVNE